MGSRGSTHVSRGGSYSCLLTTGIALLILLGSSACASVPGNTRAPDVPPLQLPGVTQVPISAIVTNANRGVVDSVSILRSRVAAGRGELLLRDDAQWYQLELDGSKPQRVALPCEGAISQNASGDMLACRDGTGASVIPSDALTEAVHLHTVDAVNSVALSPDGLTLAATTRGSSACAIEIYRLLIPSPDVQLLAHLSLPDFSPQTGPCGAGGLAWSADGAWLAMIDNIYAAQSKAYVFDLSTFLTNHGTSLTNLLHGSEPQMLDLSVRVGDMSALGPVNGTSSLNWSLTGGHLGVTFLRDDWTIVRQDPQTGQKQTLVDVPTSQHLGVLAALGLTLAPSGPSLVFAEQAIVCADCPLPAYPSSHVYTYTPPAGTS